MLFDVQVDGVTAVSLQLPLNIKNCRFNNNMWLALREVMGNCVKCVYNYLSKLFHLIQHTCVCLQRYIFSTTYIIFYIVVYDRW